MKRSMKRIPYFVFSIFILTGMLGGCGDSSESEDPVDAGLTDGETMDTGLSDGEVEEEDGAVENGEKPLGSWMNVFDEPITGPNDVPAEAVVCDIGESDIVMVFYDETVQVTGAKGFYEMDEEEGDTFHVTLTHQWEEAEMDWVEFGEPFGMPHPFTFSEDSLMAKSPEGDEIPMVKTEFVQLEAIAGEWLYSDGTNEATIILAADGTYSYEQEGDDFGAYSEEGSWSAMGEGTGYLRTIGTTVEGSSPVYIEALTEYELTEEEGEEVLILYYPDGEGGLFPVTFSTAI